MLPSLSLGNRREMPLEKQKPREITEQKKEIDKTRNIHLDFKK